jgi:hypothetical protein
VGKKKNTVQNRRARGLVEKLVEEKFFFLIAAFLLWVKVVVGKGRGKIGIGELHFFKPADVSFAPYLEPKETIPCFFVGECEGVCRTPFKALFVNLHSITTHFLTFHHTIHFIFFKKKKPYQIIHFLYHIIYYLNKKKITTKQIFSLSNTTFSFSHINHLFIYFNP